MTLTDDIRKRLKEVIEESGYSAREFSYKLGYQFNRVHEILRGRNRRLSAPFVRQLTSCFDVNPIWLETGMGSRYNGRQDPSSKEQAELLRNYEQLNLPARKLLFETSRTLLQLQTEKSGKKKRKDSSD